MRRRLFDLRYINQAICLRLFVFVRSFVRSFRPVGTTRANFYQFGSLFTVHLLGSLEYLKQTIINYIIKNIKQNVSKK